MTTTATVTRRVDSDWEMNAALNTLNAARNSKASASALAAYAEAVRVNVALGKLVVAEGLQAEYRRASIDRINAFTRVVA